MQQSQVLDRPRTAQTSGLTRYSPFLWAVENAKIVTPGLGVEQFRPHAFQAKLLMDRAPRRLVLKARQTGLSTTIALEAVHAALYHEHDRTLFVSRNQELAGLLIHYCRTAIAGLPDPVTLVAESQSKLIFPNGSEILSLPANPATGRGYPASRVYLDEFAYVGYDALILQGILPTLSNDGQITVLSTPRGRNNEFWRLWSGLDSGDWSKHTIRWDQCPRYDAAWAERTRANMTRQAWAEEFNCDFLSSGDAVFDTDDLARCRVGHIGTAAGCSQFITAWDVGRKQDHSVGITLGQRGDIWHVVDFERFLAPFPVTQARIEARARIYGRTLVESNGIGDPVIENLVVAVEPFQTTAKTKLQAIQSLQLLMQKGQFKFGQGHEQLERELGLYEFEDKNLVQDCVMSAVIAASVAYQPSGASATAPATPGGYHAERRRGI